MIAELRLYLSSVLLSIVLSVPLWITIALIKGWPVRMTLPFLLLFAVLSLLCFCCYLLIPMAKIPERKKMLFFYLPFIVAIIARGYYVSNVLSGRIAEFNFSWKNSLVKPWHGKIAECLIILIVCLIMQRKYRALKVEIK
ncbi:MAG: hypothetical protein Q8941_13690 [Bacteroidota bacterium]|nr:hypothetical protein [Bacteroidota bacterium]